MSLPPRFLDELRARLSLAEMVGRRVKLARRGREFVGLCPFHNEKTPSFNVVEDKGFYHCFGCGAHGDVIGFSMRIDNLSFRDAVESLAPEAGLAIPEESPHDRERAVHAATLFDVCEAACDFFARQLRAPTGARGAAYIRARGVDPKMVEHFRLGFAPSGGTALLDALTPNFPRALLEEAGLVRADEHKTRWYDFFRDRVIFPIADRQDRIIAFGGRIIGDGQPKYINSPDTPIFQKGLNLYALNFARKAARDQPVIVAEGYMDVIALHAAGFTGAVAPLGTALTEEQLLEIWKQSGDPILCFDGDTAGRRAADRAVERALPMIRAGRALRFVTLPRGEDPDSLIRSLGAPEFARFAAAAKPLSAFLWELATEGKPFTTPERVIETQDRLKTRILRIEDRETQRYYLRFVSDMIWDLQSKNRKAFVARGKETLSPQIAALAKSSAAADQEKIKALLITIVLNHPAIVRVDVDQFANIMPKQRWLYDLHQKILDLLADGTEREPGELYEILRRDGFGDAIRRLLGSETYRSHAFCRQGMPFERALLGWKATFSRFLLPDVKRQLDDSLLQCSSDPTVENWESMLMYRQLFEEQHMEAELMRESEPLDRAEWRPNAKVA